jgi:hypothetical protein
MSRYFTIKITGGTSPGPYTIYYDSFPSDNIATIYDSDPIEYASGLTLNTLTDGDGLIVEVPEDVEILYLYNELCSEESISICASSFMCFTYRGLGQGGVSTFSCSVREGDLLFNGKRWWDLNNCPVNENYNPFFPEVICPTDVGFVWWDNGSNVWRYTSDLGGGDYYSYLNNPGDLPIQIIGTYEWISFGQATCAPEMINSTFGICVSENPQPLVPPVIKINKDFCLSYYPSGNPNARKFYQFTPSDVLDSNGNPTWYWVLDPNSKVVWNTSVSQWDIINLSPDNLVFFDDVSSINSNPPLNWRAIGGGSSITVVSVSGSCTTSGRSTFPVSINQPTCFCDGSIIFNVSLDNPPYSYSIDNGVTYSSSPIFTNLCSGIYLLSVSDYLGNVFSKTITIDKPETATTYTLSLNTIKTTPIINEISLVNSYETTVTVTPPLPDGTTITFDLIHDNNFYSSPTSGTSVLTTGTILNSNFTTIPVSLTSTGNTKSVNTTPGCQSDFIYQSDINEVWNSITLTNTDTIVISTTTRVDKTTTGLCVVGYSNDTYSISNAIISGCDCCSLIVNA